MPINVSIFKLTSNTVVSATILVLQVKFAQVASVKFLVWLDKPNAVISAWTSKPISKTVVVVASLVLQEKSVRVASVRSLVWQVKTNVLINA